MSNSVVTVDSAWISSNGPAPFILNAENTTYQLATDVNVNDANFFGDVFVIGARNVFLDKNGFYIYVNGSDYPQKTDGHIYDVAGHPIRLSEATTRGDKTADDLIFGGVYNDGNDVQTLIDPTSPEFPLVNSWSDTA